MTILEMMEKRKKAWEAAKNFAESHRTENGTMSDEDYGTYQNMEKEISDFTREIQRMQREEQMEQALSQPVNAPLTGKPMKAGEPEEKTGRASDQYRRDMITALRTNFRQVSNLLQEGVDSDGGYLVPEEYDSRLVDVLTENNIMRTLGHKLTTSGLHKINMTATKPAALWVEEGGQLTFSDATFGQITIDAYKLAVGVKITNELLNDNAFNLESYIIQEFGKALGNAEEDAFLNGDGNHKPLGLFHADGGATADVTTGTIGKIDADDILNLIYALKRPYRKNSAFIMNDQIINITLNNFLLLRYTVKICYKR